MLINLLFYYICETYLLMYYRHTSLLFRVVNGALEFLAKDLGIAENAVLKGKLGV